MPDGTPGGVTFTLDGSHLRVDARPARLVSMLKQGDGAPIVTAQPAGGAAKVEEFPTGARQATFQIRDDVTVEATQAATFVAVAEESGRCLVISYGGELTVVPGGDDRFALAADEALVISGPGTEPMVVPVSELSADSHPDVASLLDATTDAVFAAAATTASTPSEAVAAPEERTVEVAPTSDKPASGDGPAKKAETTPAKAAKKAAGAAAGATGAAAGGSGGGGPAGGAPGGGRRKKGKKGRPQPQKSGGAKKAATGAGAAGAGAAAGGAAAAGTAGAAAAKKAPAKATGGGGKQPPKTPAKTGGGGGGGGGGHDDDSYEDTPRDRRFLIGAVLVALVLAVGAVLLLSSVGDDTTEVATGDDTTTTVDEEVADTTTSSTTPPSTTTTTAARATTTTAQATTTTARATTTTARPTTTTAAPQPKYSIEPKSCVQNGNSITYTASVKNDSPVAYDYTIDVSFKTSDGSEVAKASANVTRLAPGRSADFSATGTSSRSLAGTGASCDVTRVDARPSS